MCCGQKRTALKDRSNLTATPNLAQSAPRNVAARTPFPSVPPKVSAPHRLPQSATMTAVAGLHSTITLRYSEASPIQVRGPITGNVYVFSRSHPVQAVEARDAATLLHTRFFHRAY